MKLSKQNKKKKIRVALPLKRPVGMDNVIVFIQAVPVGWVRRTHHFFPEDYTGVPVIVTAIGGGRPDSILPDEKSVEFQEAVAKRDLRLKAFTIAIGLDWHEEQSFDVDFRETFKKSQADRNAAADKIIEEMSAEGLTGGDIDRIWQGIMTISNEMDLWGDLGSDFLAFPLVGESSTGQENTISERKSKSDPEPAST